MTKRSIQQLVYYLDIVALREWEAWIEGSFKADICAVRSEIMVPTDIETFVQEWDREWSPLEKQIFGAYEIKILETPQSEERMGSTSFAALPWTPWEVTCDIVARCDSLRPALIFAKGGLDKSSDANPDGCGLTIIGDLIGMLEMNLEHDDALAMRELLYDAGRSSQEANAADLAGLTVGLCEDVPGSPIRPDCPCASCRRSVAALHGDEGRGR